MKMSLVTVAVLIIIVIAAFLFYYVGLSDETAITPTKIESEPELNSELVVESTTTTTVPIGALAANMLFADMTTQNATYEQILWLEKRAFDLVNRERIDRELPALKWNEEIAAVARNHSEDMAENDFFDHTGSDGSVVSGRLHVSDVYYWNYSSENLYMSSGIDYYRVNIFGNVVETHYMTLEQITRNATQGWMGSLGHRKNMLDERVDESGMGIYVINDSFYFTQNFITRVDCGYKDGECCEMPGYVYCYVPFSCESGVCSE